MKLNKYVVLGLALIISGAIGADGSLNNAQGVVASAQNESDIKPYVSFMAGMSKNKWVESKSAANISGSIGLKHGRFSNEISIHGIVASHPKDNSTSHHTNFSIFINSAFNFLINSAFTPYVGGGVGMSKMFLEEKNDTTHDETKTSPSYQLIIGSSLFVNEDFDLFADFRHLSTFKKLRYAGSREPQRFYRNQSVNIGIRFRFF